MFDEDTSPGLLGDDEAVQMLQELAANTPEELRRRRTHFRLSIKMPVILQPGNASELLSFKVKGVTADLSQGGCSAVLPVPIRVGDMYRLQFDRGTLDLPLTFARCVRCRLLREDAFEAGFSFFTTITLPERVIRTEAPSLVR